MTSRRDVLKAGLFGGAALALPLERMVRAASPRADRLPQSRLPAPFTIPFAQPPVAKPIRSDATTDYYRITMAATQLEIVPGLKTPVFAYEGSVPGPTIKATRGRPAVVRMINKLPGKHPKLGYVPYTSTHLHGSASLPQYDGYASDITYPGFYKDYRYPNFQNARTMWYHDHGVHHTAENVYSGLLAQYHLVDPAHRGLGLPTGEFDVPLILGDAMFATDGSLIFSLDDQSGFWGDVILVNGRPWPVMKVKRRKYRFRLLGAAVSRSFELSLDSGQPFTVIATDGGFVPVPQQVWKIRQGTGERYEVVVDFSLYQPGQRVVLRNTSPDKNENFPNVDKVMAFDVVADAFDPSNNSVPATLPADPTMALDPAKASKQRSFRLERKNGLWTVSGDTWAKVEASKFQYVAAEVPAGAVEVWTLENKSGGWFHPLHIHLIDFKIFERNRGPVPAYELGPKDVAYLGPNESVRAIARFDGAGKYMMHCHNLVHEDHDMMTQFRVVNPAVREFEPFAAPSIPLPERTKL